MEKAGHKVWWATIAAAIAVVGMGLIHPRLWWLEVVFVPLALLGLWDVIQKRHSILRNYPMVGHMRFLLEGMGPEIHQYFVEGDEDGRPFNRDARSVIYRRAKGVEDKKPFGTEKDVYRRATHGSPTRSRPVRWRRTPWAPCARPWAGRTARSRTRLRSSTSPR